MVGFEVSIMMAGFELSTEVGADIVRSGELYDFVATVNCQLMLEEGTST